MMEAIVSSFRTRCSPAVSPTSGRTRLALGSSKAQELGPIRPTVMTRPIALESGKGPLSGNAEIAKRKCLSRHAGCHDAMRMLTLRPVFATPVPRLRVGPRAPDGTFRVHDRAKSEDLVVYSPRFLYQFRAGHHAGQWYVRPATDVGMDPYSPGFPTAQCAIDAIRAGRWVVSAQKRYCRPTTLRVMWPQT